MTKRLKTECTTCSLSELCLPLGLNENELEQFSGIIVEKRNFHRGDYLFREGQVFTNIAAIRAGSFKGITTDIEGIEHVRGFYFPGELLGFHAIHSQRYAISLIALETSSVCMIPYPELFRLSRELPKLQEQLFSVMSQKLLPQFKVDPNNTAEQRIARLLLNISARFKCRGYSATEFRLSMSREDIGHYLGLATETISRIFKHLADEGVLEVNRRDITLKDMRRLQILACG